MRKATVVFHGYRRQTIFRNFKTLLAFQAVIGVLIFLAPHGLLMADQNDTPHRTHLLHARGPHISNCSECHTDTPGYDKVDWNACASCHTVGVPPNPDWQGDNPYEGSSGMDGYYTRDYTPAAHGGEPGAGGMDCHGDEHGSGTRYKY